MAARGSPQEPAPPGRPHSGGRAGTGGQGALARGAHTSIRLTLQQILAGICPGDTLADPEGTGRGEGCVQPQGPVRLRVSYPQFRTQCRGKAASSPFTPRVHSCLETHRRPSPLGNGSGV